MGHTRHAHILMKPEEYDVLRALADRRGVSVSSLVREAIRQCYMVDREADGDPVAVLASLQLDLPPWEALKEELAEAKADGLP